MREFGWLRIPLDRARRFLSPPTLSDDEDTVRTAQVLNAMSWLGLLLTLVYSVLWAFIMPQYMGRLIYVPLALVATGGPLILIRKKRVRLASLVGLSGVWLLVTVVTPSAGGTRAPLFGLYTLIVMVAALVSGWHIAFGFAVLAIGAGSVMVVLDHQGLIPIPLATPLSAFLTQAALMIILTATVYYAVSRSDQALQRARHELAGRQTAEQALRESEARFKALVANSSDIVTVIQPDGTIAFESPSTRRLLGYAPEELIGQNAFDYIHPDDLPQVAAVFAEKIQHIGSTATIEYRFRHSNGSWVYLESLATNLLDDPIIRGGVINSRDVTDRRRAEALLATERILLRTVIDHLPDNIFVKDRDSRFVLNNAASLATLGVSRQEDVLGKCDLDFFPPELAEPWRAQEQVVMQSGQPILDVEEFQPWRNDKRRWVIGSTIPLHNEQGELSGLLGVSRDITERKRAEEARFLSESRYRSLAENLPDSVILLYDRNMRFVLVDGPEVERSGYSKVGLEGKTLHEALPKDFVTTVEPNMRALLEGNRFWAELPYADQVYLYNYVPLRNEQGDVIYGMILGQNITQRKQAEQALRDSEERYRQAVENSPNPIFAVDRQSLVQMWNRACRDVLLYSTDIIGHPYQELLLMPAEAASLETMVARVFEGQAFSAVDIAYRCQNGAIRYAVSRLYPVFDVTGQVSQCVFANTDITARRQIEERLRASEEELRQLSDAPLEGICIADQGRMILANKQIAEMFGYEHDELLGKSVLDLVAPESRELVFSQIRAGYDHPYEHVALRRDGSTFPVEVYGRAMLYQGRQVRLTAIRDITLRKEAEAQRLQAEKLRVELEKERELNELKSRFVSLVSHEFRTPLTSIQMACEVMQRYSSQITDEQKAARLTQIHDSVQHMAKLLDEVLTISRVERGKLAFNPQPLDVKQFCQDIVDLMQEDAAPRRIVFSPAGECSSYELDGELLQHILSNLLTNAVKYSPTDSTIHVDLQCQPEQVVVRVRDEGIGIPIEDQRHLFEPFYRARNVGQVSGTGLGLTIVKQMVERHSGSITFDSAVGVGTTFTFVIPTNLPYEDVNENIIDH